MPRPKLAIVDGETVCLYVVVQRLRNAPPALNQENPEENAPPAGVENQQENAQPALNQGNQA